MSQNPQFPYHVIQVPMMPQAQPVSKGEMPPARVRLALMFHAQISGKTASTIGVGQVGQPEEFKGQVLTKDEEDALAAAAETLEKYFRGQLSPTPWEKNGSDGRWNGMTGLPMKCHYCFDPRESPSLPKAECPACRGCGHVIVFPMVPTRE